MQYATNTPREDERTEKRAAAIAVAVTKPMNDHGAMAVESVDTNACYQVVEYASPRLRRYLGRFSRGETIALELERIETRGNCWRAVAVAGPSAEI